MRRLVPFSDQDARQAQLNRAMWVDQANLTNDLLGDSAHVHHRPRDRESGAEPRPRHIQQVVDKSAFQNPPCRVLKQMSEHARAVKACWISLLRS